MALEMGDEVGAMRAALVGIADRVDREPDALGETELTPQARQHDDLLGVDVRAGEAERLDVELMELPVAALLRALVAEHRAARPHALGTLID